MLLQSQGPRFSELFQMSCAPLQSLVNLILFKKLITFFRVNMHSNTRLTIKPKGEKLLLLLPEILFLLYCTMVMTDYLYIPSSVG